MIFTNNSITLSWNLLWFICLLWIIQISEQYANCQLLLRHVLWYSWLIFWTIFKSWSSNVHLWSISIPNNSSYLRLLSWSPQHLYAGHCQILLKDKILCMNITHVYVYEIKKTLDWSLRDTHKKIEIRAARETFFVLSFPPLLKILINSGELYSKPYALNIMNYTVNKCWKFITNLYWKSIFLEARKA